MALASTLPEISDVIRVLAADSNPMASQLLASALDRDEQLEVLEPVSDPAGIVATVVKEKPSVVMVSAEMAGDPRRGFQVVREIMASRPETRVVVLLDSSERSLVVEAFRAGARGVFCRNEALKTLAKCILCVSQGQVWANHAQLRYLLEALGEALPMRTVDTRGAALLSRREQEVVRCVAEGLSNREIAQRLSLTEHTVRIICSGSLTSWEFPSAWKWFCLPTAMAPRNWPSGAIAGRGRTPLPGGKRQPMPRLRRVFHRPPFPDSRRAREQYKEGRHF